MARRSALDLKYGDDIRAGTHVACPVCGTTTRWQGVAEFARHVRYCRSLALGLSADDAEEVIPHVEQKPRGWDWLS